VGWNKLSYPSEATPRQGFPDVAFVECPKDIRRKHPIGTRFRIHTKISMRDGGKPFLHSNFQWQYKIVTDG
jgi:hypothetical protein